MANLLTTLRLILTAPIVVLILEDRLTPASFLILIGGLTDWFDGNFARKGDKSNFGKLYDPVVDKIFSLSIFIALVGIDKVDAVPVIFLAVRELLISLFRSLAAEKGIIMEASMLGKIKAFLEFASLFLITADIRGGEIALWLAIAFAYISAGDYLLTYLKYKEKPTPEK